MSRARNQRPPAGTTFLYRPVGLHELRLIEARDGTGFPPRLPHQPFFYPVLEEAYAIQIAKDWNLTDEASGFAGYVTRFAAADDYLVSLPIRTVGSAAHQEYWIAAEDLDGFNLQIVGRIEVLHRFEQQSWTCRCPRCGALVTIPTDARLDDRKCVEQLRRARQPAAAVQRIIDCTPLDLRGGKALEAHLIRLLCHCHWCNEPVPEGSVHLCKSCHALNIDWTSVSVATAA